jgi:hypothetical protein
MACPKAEYRMMMSQYHAEEAAKDFRKAGMEAPAIVADRLAQEARDAREQIKDGGK